MLNILKKYVYYLSIAYKDLIFRIFVVIFSAKVLAFCVYFNFGFSSFIPTVGAILGISSLCLLLNNKYYKLSYLISIDIVFSLFLVSQSLYFKFFEDFISFYNITQLSQLPKIQKSILSIVYFEVIYLVDIFIIPILFFKKIYNSNYLFRERFTSFIVILTLCLYFNLAYIINRNFANSHISRYLFTDNFGIVTYQIDDIYSYFSDKLLNKAISPTELVLAKNYLATHTAPETTNCYSGIGKSKNLIFIQVESLQKFAIGMKVNGKEITPNLNRLRDHGIMFTNVYDQSWAGSSSDATFLSNCSLYPVAKGTVAFRHAQNHYDSLAKYLGENGYTTIVMHAYLKTFWNFNQIDKSLGFKHQIYEDNFKIDDEIGWGLSDRSFFLQSMEKIKPLPRPFYILMRTLTTHDPFDSVTTTIDNLQLGSLNSKKIGRYLRSMHYVDAAIGEFLHGLAKTGLLSDTVLVVYGDHRARIPDNELMQIGVHDNKEWRKIPVIVSNTNWSMHDSVETVGGLIDLAPTVCNIMGLPTKGLIFLGKDLCRPGIGYVIFRNGSFISTDGFITEETARKALKVSDLIIEKNCLLQLKTVLNNEKH